MKNKKVIVSYAVIILKYLKWKPTISHLGTKAEKQRKKIVRCYAKSAIEENREDENYWLPNLHPTRPGFLVSSLETVAAPCQQGGGNGDRKG